MIQADPLRDAMAKIVTSPFLVASASFAGCGFAWVAMLLIQAYPWLLFFGASAWCLLLHAAFEVYRGGGALSLLPPRAQEAARRPIFEFLHTVVADMAHRWAKWMRVVLLATVDLDDAHRVELFEELDEEFKSEIFQRPAVHLLPLWAQLMLLGSRKEMAKSSMELDASNLPRRRLLKPVVEGSEEDGRSETPSSCSRSAAPGVEMVLNFVRRADKAGMCQDSALQRVVTEKITDVTMTAVKHGGLRQARHAHIHVKNTRVGEIGAAWRSPWRMARLAIGLAFSAPMAMARWTYRIWAPEFLTSTVDWYLEQAQPPPEDGSPNAEAANEGLRQRRSRRGAETEGETEVRN